jgi:hypothetical protein
MLVIKEYRELISADLWKFPQPQTQLGLFRKILSKDLDECFPSALAQAVVRHC